MVDSSASNYSHRARRTAYSLAAGAAAVTVGGGGVANAAVVYSGLQNIAIGLGKSQALNLNDDSGYYGPINDLVLTNYVFSNGNYQGVNVKYAPGRLVGFAAGPKNYWYAKALNAGAVIDSTTTSPNIFLGSLALGAANPNAEFNNVADAFIGFSFPINSVNHFGWVRVTINNAAGNFLISDWAYEDQQGVGLVAGAGLVAPGLPGDFNSDGEVDAADYTVWRDNLGGSSSALNGNGTGNSTVVASDYDLWQANFGQGSGGAATAMSVPEPGTLGLFAAGALGLCALRTRRKQI